MLQTFYDSAWQHPGIAWLGVALIVAWMARARPAGWLRAYLLAFTVEIALDALCTGALSPVPPGVMSSVGIAFVILGDWRMFVIVERAVGGGKPKAKAGFAGLEPTRAASARERSHGWIARSVALAFVVPVLQAIAIKAWPDAFTEPRRIYLVYEALFLVLGSAFRWGVLPRRLAGATDATRRWALGALTWFVVQYALWVLSDVLILSGQAWAIGLRVVPNTMYYAGFLLFVAATAPDEARR